MAEILVRKFLIFLEQNRRSAIKTAAVTPQLTFIHNHVTSCLQYSDFIYIWHHVSFLARKYVAYSYLLNRHTKKTNFPVLSKLLYQLFSLQLGRQKIINELPAQVTCKALKPFSFITQTRTTLLRYLSNFVALSLSLTHTHTHTDTHTHKERKTNIWEK
jgi:hypothetical protein